jgi:hypothetical protein
LRLSLAFTTLNAFGEPTFRVEKMALFCNPASGGTFSSTAIEIIKWVNFFAVSYILRPGNTAFKEQLKLVNGFERYYQRIHTCVKEKKCFWLLTHGHIFVFNIFIELVSLPPPPLLRPPITAVTTRVKSLTCKTLSASASTLAPTRHPG